MKNMGFTPQGSAMKPAGLPQTVAGAYNNAVSATTNALGFTPMQVQGAGYRPAVSRANGYQSAFAQGPGPVQAGQIGQTNLNPYMNQYTGQVINSAMGDMRRANQMALNDAGAAATAAGAFGGSRHGLVEAQTNADFARNAGQMAAGLRQDAFTNAQQMAGQDIATRTQVGLANAQNALNMGQFNANSANQARQFGANAGNQNSQFNASNINQARQFGAGNSLQAQMANQSAGLTGANLGLSAANQLGNLSTLGYDMQRQTTQDQYAMGEQQRLMQQQLIDAARGQFSGWSNAPQAGLQALIAALSGSPVPESTTKSTQPGLVNMFTGLLGAFS